MKKIFLKTIGIPVFYSYLMHLYRLTGWFTMFYGLNRHLKKLNHYRNHNGTKCRMTLKVQISSTVLHWFYSLRLNESGVFPNNIEQTVI